MSQVLVGAADVQHLQVHDFLHAAVLYLLKISKVCQVVVFCRGLSLLPA